MSVYKEAWYLIKQLQVQSRSIYIDSCDEGVRTVKGDRHWNMAKQLVEGYGDEGSRDEVPYGKDGKVISHTLTIADEGSKKWYRLKISFVKCDRYKPYCGWFELGPMAEVKI